LPSRWKDRKPRIGAAIAKPVAQAIDVHSNGENFEFMVCPVSLLYLHNSHHISSCVNFD
jgi:hypothetical protein